MELCCDIITEEPRPVWSNEIIFPEPCPGPSLINLLHIVLAYCTGCIARSHFVADHDESALMRQKHRGFSTQIYEVTQAVARLDCMKYQERGEGCYFLLSDNRK